MFKFKELKKASKNSLKKNYIVTIIVCFIGLIFLSLYGGTSFALINDFERIQNLFDKRSLYDG